MMKIIFNNKIYFFLILIVVLYIFEFTLFLKTFNGGYFLSKVTNNQIVSSKFISNFVTQSNTHLSVFNNQKIKIYCNKKKNLSHNFDKYGFINSNQQWNILNENVILKSYSEINCNDFNLKKSEKFSLKSKNNLDLGSISTGPLHQYSILKEYFDKIKTKKVFWFHFEGSDLSDFNNLKNSKFKKYFDNDNFKQNLSSYDVQLKEEEIKRELSKFDQNLLKKEIKNFLFFFRSINFLKQRIFFQRKIFKDLKNYEINELARILYKTNIFLNENNIKFIFFYIPMESEPINSIKNTKIKKKLFEELKKNNITFIDLTNKKYLNFDQKIYLDELVKS